MSPRRPRSPAKKTGPLKDNLKEGFKPRENALEGEVSQTLFIPKIK